MFVVFVVANGFGVEVFERKVKQVRDSRSNS